MGGTMSRRRIMGVGAGGASAALLAACGGAGQSVPAGKKLPPATVAFLLPVPGDVEVGTKRAADFQAEYPNIKLDVQQAEGDYVQKVAALAAANSLGDIMIESTSAGAPQALYLRKVVQPIDSFVQKDKLDLKQWYPHVIEAAHVDGKLFALPYDGKFARVAVWINKTMFDKAGLKLPDLNWTVDQYMDAAVKLTNGADGPDKDWGMATNLKTDFSYVQAHVRRWGGDVFDKTARKATMDSAQAQAAFQWAYDMYFTKRVAPAGGDETKLFNSGHGAIMLHRDFNQKPNVFIAAKQNGFEPYASVGPKGPTGSRGGFWDFRACWMWTQTKAKDAAWEFQKYICNKESGMAKLLQTAPGTSTTPGARPDIFADPRFLNNNQYPRQIQEMEAESMNSNDAQLLPWNYRVDELSAAINPFIDQIVKNVSQPNTSFMKQINDAVQQVLNLPVVS